MNAALKFQPFIFMVLISLQMSVSGHDSLPDNSLPTGSNSLSVKADNHSMVSELALPNLVPYKPSTWDNTLVISSVTGTSSSSSPVFNTQTLYVDWAVINNSTVAISQTFYTKLYIDGELNGTWFTEGLAAGAWAYIMDHNIGKLTPGSHSIKIQTDMTGVVAESNESDNAYTRTITVYPYVNLTAYKPSGWDDKIVLSTVTGTHTSDSQILSTDNIYLDWSVANVGSYSTTTTFYIDLYIDDVWKAAWTRTGLGASSFTTQLDYLVGKLSPGSHTFKLRIDNDNYIKEYNENDNEYSRTITVFNKNLLLYQRAGWDNKLILSTVTGTGTSAAAIYNNQDIYVDWSVLNNGSANITETFHSKLMIDGVQKGYWYTAGLAANYTAMVLDIHIGKLPTGWHTAQIITDCNAEVAESNEADNSYSRTFYVGASYNLTPYQPAGYDNKLVLSTVKDTHTSASVIYDTQKIYLDWACINNANDDIAGTFFVRLYIDGVARAAWSKTGLSNNTYTYGNDYEIGPLSAGAHTFKIVVDSDGDIAESDETDNEYSRTFTVINKNLLPYQPAGWDSKLVVSTTTGTNTSASSLCDDDNIYVDYAIHNSGNAAITETFYIRLYVDGVTKATWTRAGLGANTYYTIQDYLIGTLPAGNHTLKITADVLNGVEETNEADNEFTRTILVTTCKNLTPYKPPTWDNKLVISTVTGTNTSATGIYPNQNIFVDWAVINDGANHISENFSTKLYLDGVLKATWTKTGLNTGAYLYHSDFSAGMLPAGVHTFKVVTDSENTVLESDEGDNEFSRTITVLLPAPVATAANDVTQTGFSANWDVVANATGYYLDVSANNTFTAYIAGFNNKNVGNTLTTPITGLNPGTTYYYRVRATNASSTSGNSNIIGVTTIPPAPVAMPATNLTQTSFIANWRSTAGASGYVIDVATDNGFTKMVSGYDNKKLGNILAYTVTGLDPCTEYYYRIRAYNSSGTGSDSGVITAKTLCVPGAVLSIENVTGNAGSTVCVPVMATGLTDAAKFQFSVTYDHTKLTYINCTNWSGGTNASAVVIVSQPGGKLSFVYNNSAVNIASGKFFEICFTLKTGTAGSTPVTWSDDPTVRKFTNSSDLNIPCSYNNGSVEIIVLPPSPPVAVNATFITKNSFTANWNASENATGYYLDVATDNSFTEFVDGFENKDAGNAVTANVTGLSAGTEYYYRVRAYNAGGTSSHSNTISAATMVNVPPAPEATAAINISQNGFTANWNASAGAEGYYLDVSTSNSFSGFVAGYNNKNVGNVLTADIAGLTAGTAYYYRVRAYNAGGTSENSNTISAKTLMNPPAVPIALPASGITQTGFIATWSASAGATGYYLDVSMSSTFDDFVTSYGNKDVGNTTNTVISGLDPGTVYYYRLRAYHSEAVSGNSNTITAVTLVNKPEAPEAISATDITPTGFRANWIASPGATGYKIDVSINSDFTSIISGYNKKDVGNVTTTVISGLDPGTTYYYRLQAYNAGGNSDNSNTVEAVTSITPPAAPLANAATAVTQTGFTANWNSSSGATGYYLDVSTNSAFTGFVAGYDNKDVGNTVTFRVTGLSAGTTYHYRLRAYNSAGSGVNSNVITVITSVEVPGAPVANPATNITQTGFTANWNASPGATAYLLDVALTSSFDDLLTDYGNKEVGNVTNSQVTGLETGTTYYYRIRAYNSGGTSPHSNSVSVSTLTTGIRINYVRASSVKIYPNPTTGPVKIETDNVQDEITVSVCDISGSEIIVRKFNTGGEILLDLSGYAPGIYLCRLNDGKRVIVQKIILDKLH